MGQSLQSGGCAVNYANTEVYVFGGWSTCSAQSNAICSIDDIDYYSMDNGQWTTADFQLPNPTRDLKCFSNIYDQTIICPGGWAQSAYDDTVIYRTIDKEIIQEISLVNSVTSYGLASYEFIDDATDQATILFVIGGYNGGAFIYADIQYIVIYNVPTTAPTPAPTALPTSPPSSSPTQPPTLSPTDIPTQPPSSSPSNAPSTAPSSSPTDSQVGTAPPKDTEVFGIDTGDAASFSM